jgi:signal transduction histidine kinase
MALPKGLSKINTLLTDTNGVIWIGTDFDGLWIYRNNKFRPFSQEKKYPVYGIINLYQNNQVIWMAALSGLFSIKNFTIKKENVPHTIYATIALGTDTLMLGTLNGVYVFHRRNGTLEKQAFLPNATVLCFAADQKYLYIGTDDRGVVCWNRETHKFSKITEDSGLSCNYVYSLLMDRSGNLWVGTGCGIDEISFNDNQAHIKNFGPSDGLGGLENNANASFEDADGYLWFGTNRGLFKYNPYAAAPKSNTIKPRVVFKSIKLFSKEILPGKFSDSLLPFSTIPYNPIFPPDKNHLTFTFKGICLSSPDKIKYRYQLIGIDKQATETSQNTVVYPNLPSGHYVFKVWASDAAGDWDIHNAIEYPFTINTPFYKTLVFKIGLALLLIALFLGAVYYRNLRKSARQRWTEKMREEEQARVRQKTAEDFHDEIGNKLTRISLLTTIMESKTKDDNPEVKEILQQINKNIGSLYHGAKDIIWSLQPESDFLDEIIRKVRQNTEEILDGSGIHFEFEQSGNWPMHYKLPPEYSRNLIMIFKEAVNNIIKHAEAKNLKLTFKKENESVLIILRDDGKGFITSIKGEGNGLQNMQRRADRIKGKLVIESSPGKGTALRLYL